MTGSNLSGMILMSAAESTMKVMSSRSTIPLTKYFAPFSLSVEQIRTVGSEFPSSNSFANVSSSPGLGEEVGGIEFVAVAIPGAERRCVDAGEGCVDTEGGCVDADVSRVGAGGGWVGVGRGCVDDDGGCVDAGVGCVDTGGGCVDIDGTRTNTFIKGVISVLRNCCPRHFSLLSFRISWTFDFPGILGQSRAA